MDMGKRILGIFFGCLFLSSSFARADDVDFQAKQNSSTVYVPLYSHIYFGDSLKPFNLAATVSIRNVDQKESLTLLRADYYDSEGKLIRKFLEKPIIIPPLASHSVKIRESDIEGGSGASVLVHWKSVTPVVRPLVESVMIGAAHGQGISFTSRGKVIGD
jgi:hypothetical protein